MNETTTVAWGIDGKALPPVPTLARSLERRRLQVYIAMLLVDATIVVGAFLLAGVLYLGTSRQLAVTLPAQLILPIFLTIALYNSSYSIESLRDWGTGAKRAITALLVSAFLLNFLAFFAKINSKFSRVGFVIGFILAVTALIFVRWLFARLSHRLWGENPINVLVIDDGGPPINLRGTTQISAAEHGLTPALDDPHAFDRLSRYIANMDQVLVSCPLEKRVAWAMVLKGAGIHGEVTSEFMSEIGALGVVRRDEIGLSTLLVATGPLGIRARFVKRALDIMLSLFAIVATLPILLVAAIAIKLEDGGPVLFRQRRIGRHNQLFSIYKLRTMTVAGSDAEGNRSTSKGDSRVTRIGNFLRKSSIDELPQLLNVLRGDMSMVGPRPHAIGSLAGDKLFWEVDHRYWHRHSLRPGLTGLAQIRGLRGATDFEADLARRLQADLEYLAGWTIWRDFAILFGTFRVLVHDRAY